MKDAVSRYLAEGKILDEAYGMLDAICYSKNSSHKRLYLIPRTQRGFLFLERPVHEFPLWIN